MAKRAFDGASTGSDPVSVPDDLNVLHDMPPNSVSAAPQKKKRKIRDSSVEPWSSKAIECKLL